MKHYHSYLYLCQHYQNGPTMDNNADEMKGIQSTVVMILSDAMVSQILIKHSQIHCLCCSSPTISGSSQLITMSVGMLCKTLKSSDHRGPVTGQSVSSLHQFCPSLTALSSLSSNQRPALDQLTNERPQNCPLYQPTAFTQQQQTITASHSHRTRNYSVTRNI